MQRRGSNRGGRFSGIGETFVGNKFADMMMPALAKNKKIMGIGNNAQIINSYIQNMNKNKERGTPSSAVRTTAPKLYL